MLQAWVVIAIALGYIGLLFVVASYGDRVRLLGRSGRSRLLIYPLCLAIYCTSWTFFGSVGLASRSGFDFLTIYVGPILMIGLFWPLILRIVRLAKSQNITSIADFIAARYGKQQAVAATVALIAIVGTIPYIALQLKAVSSSVGTILAHISANAEPATPVIGDVSLIVALLMAVFAILFGTRHIDATEHQDGLMLAIATESIVKLAAFLAVGIFVTWWMFDGAADLFARAMAEPQTAALFSHAPSFASVVAMTVLSFFAIVLLPRQFHVTVVENHAESEVKRASWLFPIYLVLINLFVIPIALAGLLTFPSDARVDGDMYVLALPLSANSPFFTVAAFVGGLSAATAMVIVECVALAIMVSNDLIVPFVLQQRAALITSRADVGALLLTVRRISIFAILLMAYLYYRSVGDAQLAAIGLLSFAAVAQLAPAFFGGMFWRHATARGAIAGMTIGFLAWAYTLLLPSAAGSGILSASVLTDGPWGIAMLRPQALFGLDLPPLAHGVFWSLALNILAYVGFSLGRAPTAIERMQADLFVPSGLAPVPSFRLWRSTVTVEEVIATVSRYIGEGRTRTSFENFARAQGLSLKPSSEADFQLLRHAEHLLASAIGAASSRLVLSLLLRKRTVSTKAALKLLDDANAAIHYNREILQTALEHVSEGIAVFDKDLQLICWNRQFGEILGLPRDMIGMGVRLEDILHYHASRGLLGEGDPAELVQERLKRYSAAAEPFQERFPDRGLVMEVRANKMPDGSIATTFTDITPSVEAAEALEQRVRERTTELTLLNAELARAKATADEANISKTRFLAAASHDILQPLNAARLYVTSLVERQGSGEEARLVGNIDASLDAVEEIFGALLDISRLDTGVMKPEFSSFRIADLLRQLEVEFAPLAREKGLRLTFVPSSLTVKSDRRLLRRLLQNLISNAIKYTPKGRVLVGVRRQQERLRIDVYDTGLGIPKSQRRIIFREFQRLDEGAKVARGLGLGLSIVERIARVLDHKVELSSQAAAGSHFSVEVPLTAPVQTSVPEQPPLRVDPGQLAGMTVLCIDNEPQILDGMEALLTGWGCSVLKAADLKAAHAALESEHGPLSGLLVDYHLDNATGMDAIAALRARIGRDLPAILITADRTPRVREEARRHNIPVLHKPVKPAALRALLAQWRIQRAAAAE